MSWIALTILLQVYAQEAIEPPTPDPTPSEQVEPSETLDDCQKGLKGLINDMLGLEFFLRDKKDYKKHCPQIKWEQPSLDEYKKDLKSYLPEGCKVEED
jgi:hypothetical protein